MVLLEGPLLGSVFVMDKFFPVGPVPGWSGTYANPLPWTSEECRMFKSTLSCQGH